MQKQRKIITISAALFSILLLAWIYYRDMKYNKTEPIYGRKIYQDIYEEKYETHSGGVLDGNSYSYYLTDSTMFRKYIGKCDDKEIYRFTIVSLDTIKVVKWSWRNRLGDAPEIPIDSVQYSIKSLKKVGEFD